MYFLQLLIIGLLAGAVYGLIGVGFTLVLGIGRIPNFAQGAFVGLGLYFALFMQKQLGASPYEALVPGIVFFTLIGVVCAEVFERRGRRIGEIGELLVGLALLMVLQGPVRDAVWGITPRRSRDLISAMFTWPGSGSPARRSWRPEPPL